MKKIKNGHAYRQTGFTLIELLVVISIIGVLTTLLVVNFIGSRERASDSQKIQNLNSLKNALRLYYNDYQNYPESKSIILGSTFSDYMSDVGDTSFNYSQTDNGEGFLLEIILDTGSNIDTGASQIRCGVDVGSTQANVYAVCAN